MIFSRALPLMITLLYCFHEFVLMQHQFVFVDFVYLVAFAFVWVFCSRYSTNKFLVSLSLYYSILFFVVGLNVIGPTESQIVVFDKVRGGCGVDCDMPSNFLGMERKLTQLYIDGLYFQSPKVIEVVY